MLRPRISNPILMAMAAGLLGTFLAPAASTADPNSKEIVFVSGIAGLPVLQPARIGAQKRGEELGYEVSWVGPTEYSGAAMIDFMEIALAEEVLAVITSATEPDLMRPIYTKLREAGIPVVNAIVDAPSDKDLRIAYIGTDQTQYGINAARHLGGKLGGEGTIGVMMTTLDMGNQVAQLAAFTDTLGKEFPGMEVVLKEANNSNPVEAIQKAEAILLAYPDLDAMFCLEVTCGPATAQVIRETGREGLVVLAIDDQEDTLGYIKTGEIWGTMTQDFYRMGYESVQFIHDHINGKEIPSETDSGTVLVTSENVDTYKN